MSFYNFIFNFLFIEYRNTNDLYIFSRARTLLNLINANICIWILLDFYVDNHIICK